MKKKLFTIDIHTHILPKDIPNFNKRFGYGEFVQLEHHKPCCAKMMMNDQFFREDTAQRPERSFSFGSVPASALCLFAPGSAANRFQPYRGLDDWPANWPICNIQKAARLAFACLVFPAAAWVARLCG